MVGKTVLYAWGDNTRAEWFMGHVQRCGVPAKDKQKTPSANFVVKYTKKLTGGHLEGTVFFVRALGESVWRREMVGAAAAQCAGGRWRKCIASTSKTGQRLPGKTFCYNAKKSEFS